MSALFPRSMERAVERGKEAIIAEFPNALADPSPNQIEWAERMSRQWFQAALHSLLLEDREELKAALTKTMDALMAYEDHEVAEFYAHTTLDSLAEFLLEEKGKRSPL